MATIFRPPVEVRSRVGFLPIPQIVPNLLLTTLVVAGVPFGGAPPAPTLPAPTVARFQPPNLVLTTLAGSDNLPRSRGSAVPARVVPFVGVPQGPPNTLLGLLAGTDNLPRARGSALPARLPDFVGTPQVWPNLLGTTLAPQGTPVFGSALDTRRIPLGLGPATPIPNLLVTTLRGQDAFPSRGSAVPARVIPVVACPPVSPPNLLNTLLAGAGQSPVGTRAFPRAADAMRVARPMDPFDWTLIYGTVAPAEVVDRRSTTNAGRVGSRDNWAASTQTGGF